MENEDIISLLALTGKLLELHDENPFKVKAYPSAVFNLEKINIPLAGMALADLEKLDGVGKGIAQKINEINASGTFAELQTLIANTPPGVLDMLDIKGIGPKKVRTIWKELGVEDKQALMQACEENKVAQLKGFGEKTQETIKQSLLYAEGQKGKVFYSETEPVALHLLEILKTKFPLASVSGEFRRKLEVIELLSFVIGCDHVGEAGTFLTTIPSIEKNPQASSPFTWRGKDKTLDLALEIKIYSEKEYYGGLFLQTGAEEHLSERIEGQKTLQAIALHSHFNSEEAIYEKAGLAYILPELREGTFEVELARENKLPELIEYTDLKGAFHNHSTWSDGKNSVEEMARYCMKQGWDYLGMADHSKSAQYAQGLYENRVLEQQKEIDALNTKLDGFRIFKGIESDITGDGSLDYEEDILKTFDYVVASIHSNLKMDEAKANARLLKAIENPYTTMLGHMTGRLLLRREGYPINHQLIIDACKANDVIIEINASPWRLDIDWRWVRYALEQGVILSINPDAHELVGLLDMQYGVYTGRKGGLTKEMTFNSWGLSEVEKYFKDIKVKKGI